MGIKPLYYYPGENCFLFASEVRGIRASRIPRDVLNPDALYHYLSFGNLAAPQTLLSPIQELHPGHYLQVTPEKWEEKPYWS
ncbi:MAG: asparagine synthase (glutamine-hydrolyzing), partial [Nitrospinaceae bacterium]|nr:asparagine synthase (glutamine-hydrolyzing) [Nitrospinaceae bacterium]NIR56614.1 asparagine synthase (glutamine-hydrolyzing) [Nitrospinaceae bacterium]NIS87077.1 asparagine synthase (glutamine-hydrolyzing) [Nitrospinaceae bacterium]NIT83931.1 asparagine synthase (glutamine-hydrolyzing) [Nitrospinaceae bacterium]NIU46122.1 asparagine synthase (glutamine-hydrolyzing) [Nitrospinaceae bacterium]